MPLTISIGYRDPSDLDRVDRLVESILLIDRILNGRDDPIDNIYSNVRRIRRSVNGTATARREQR